MVNINFASLVAQAKQLPAIKTAVVHPVTAEAISGFIAATNNKIIVPILIGPIHKIQQAAAEAKVDLSPYEMMAADHSHAAAEQAVALARTGQVEMLMKGSLHTDELMQVVLDKAQGLRTAQRMSHVFVIETVSYHKLLLLTDCALNIWPDLMQKRDIVQNAIELAQALGINMPKVAILSAIEMINEKLKSTIDAAALCKMADRGQIINGILDGPLGFDHRFY